MDMKQLYKDFIKHVDSLDEQAIRKSILDAIEHSSDSIALECESDIGETAYFESPMQQISQTISSANTYGFCSVQMNYNEFMYDMDDMGGAAA